MTLALLPQAAPEKLNIKPGLWEFTITMDMSGNPLTPDMQQRIASLPPEQRAKAEAAIKNAQAGMSRPQVSQSCIRAQDLDKPMPVKPPDSSSCKQTMIKATASEQEIRMDCNSGSQKATSTVHLVESDPENMKGTVTGVVTGPQQNFNMHANFTGKWVAADCGKVKAAP